MWTACMGSDNNTLGVERNFDATFTVSVQYSTVDRLLD
jgi:hypothetical protein